MRPKPFAGPKIASFECASFECGCGQVHNSADGKLPVGWTQRTGTVWCSDCTRLGIPTRKLLAGGHPRRNLPTPAKPSTSKSAA